MTVARGFDLFVRLPALILAVLAVGLARLLCVGISTAADWLAGRCDAALDRLAPMYPSEDEEA